MSVTKALRGQKHLRSSGKGPQKWETGGAEPPGPEYRLTPAARCVHVRLRLEFNWCAWPQQKTLGPDQRL